MSDPMQIDQLISRVFMATYCHTCKIRRHGYRFTATFSQTKETNRRS